jgi:FAD-dependent urate hydroxylase
MKIAVIGAGLAGVASAVALSQAGHEVRIYEQAAALREGGYGVILWPNATGILEELGVPHTDLGLSLDRVDILSDIGDPMIRVELDRISERFGQPSLVVRRSVLVARLAELLPPGTLRFGSGCAGIEEPATGTDDPVRISLSDGSTAQADVLIGADGHRSVVRLHLLGDNRAAYTGWASWHGTTKLPVALTTGRKVQTMAGAPGLCVMHPLGDGLLYWAFETPWTDGELLPPGALASEPGQPAGQAPSAAGPSATANLRARFAGFTSPMPELLASITDDDVEVFPHVLHKIPRQWGRGRITMAGDAVHAVPPRTGMGANQALEDAWVIGRTLSESGDPEALLRRYERTRRRRVQMLYYYAAVTGRPGQSVPGLLKHSKQGFSFTGFQRLQIKAFSNFLNAPAR